MPLADRIRPSTLDEVVGQRHILAQGKPLYNIISRGKIPNMIFYGPSGVGKTTVANIIAQKTSMSLYRLNGTQASTSDIKDVVANLGTFGAAGGILLFLDEIQYLNKKAAADTARIYRERRNNADRIYDGESVFLCIQCRSFTLYRV